MRMMLNELNFRCHLGYFYLYPKPLDEEMFPLYKTAGLSSHLHGCHSWWNYCLDTNAGSCVCRNIDSSVSHYVFAANTLHLFNNACSTLCSRLFVDYKRSRSGQESILIIYSLTFHHMYASANQLFKFNWDELLWRNSCMLPYQLPNDDLATNLNTHNNHIHSFKTRITSPKVLWKNYILLKIDQIKLFRMSNITQC